MKVNHRYEIKIDLGLHDLKDLEQALKNIAFAIHRHFSETEVEFNSVSGSPTAASSVKCLFDKNMTKEKYFRLLEEADE